MIEGFRDNVLLVKSQAAFERGRVANRWALPHMAEQITVIRHDNHRGTNYYMHNTTVSLLVFFFQLLKSYPSTSEAPK